MPNAVSGSSPIPIPHTVQATASSAVSEAVLEQEEAQLEQEQEQAAQEAKFSQLPQNDSLANHSQTQSPLEALAASFGLTKKG